VRISEPSFLVFGANMFDTRFYFYLYQQEQMVFSEKLRLTGSLGEFCCFVARIVFRIIAILTNVQIDCSRRYAV